MKDESRLAELRDQIDRLDEQLVDLLNERARLALEVGIVKGDRVEVHQPEREAAVHMHVKQVNKGPLSTDAVTSIFDRIIEVCRTIQYNK